MSQLFIHIICLSVCLSIYLCLCIFHLVYLSVCLSYPYKLEGACVSIVSPDLEPDESLSVYLYFCLTRSNWKVLLSQLFLQILSQMKVYLSICLSICLSVYLSVYLYFCLTRSNWKVLLSQFFLQILGQMKVQMFRQFEGTDSLATLFTRS